MLHWVTPALAADPQAPSVRVRAGYDAVVNVAYAPLDPTALLLRAATALRGIHSTGGGEWLQRFEEGEMRRGTPQAQAPSPAPRGSASPPRPAPRPGWNR